MIMGEWIEEFYTFSPHPGGPSRPLNSHSLLEVRPLLMVFDFQGSYFYCTRKETLLMAEILHQLIGSLSHYLHGFIHRRWCRISSINSMTKIPDFRFAIENQLVEGFPL